MAMGVVMIIWAMRERGERTLIRTSGVLTGGKRAIASRQKVFLI